MLDRTQPGSLRAYSRDDPECGARRGVPRRRLVTARPGRLGTPPARHYDLAARSSLHGSEGKCPPLYGGGRRRRRKRGPGAQNRHGGAPRGERPALWDARRLARRLACRVMCTPHGCSAEHPNDSRRSAHPHSGVGEAKVQDPDAEIAPRERDGPFETVNMATNTSEGTAVPDAAQRVTKWSQKRVDARLRRAMAPLIRDSHGLERSRVCSAAAPGDTPFKLTPTGGVRASPPSRPCALAAAGGA